jgi:hypothetical protein
MSRLGNRPRLGVVLGLALTLLLVAETAVLADTLTKKGGPVQAVRVVMQDDARYITSTAFIGIPGLTTTINVPSGEKGVLLITVSATTYCHYFAPPASCRMRVLVDDNVAPPGTITFNVAFAEDASPGSVAAFAGSIQVAVGPLAAGAHTVTPQFQVSTVGAEFGLFWATLSVLRSKV